MIGRTRLCAIAVATLVMLACSQAEPRLEPCAGDYTFAQIQEWFQGPAKELLNVPGVDFLDADERLNCLIVGISDESVKDAVRRRASELGIPEDARFTDVSATHLPRGDLDGPSMDAALADLDADGDLDVVIAVEHDPNILLLNDGDGRLVNASDRLPGAQRDSEDVGIADFEDVDGDGDLDILTASFVLNADRARIDPAPCRVYLNDGEGRYSEATSEVFGKGIAGIDIVFDLEFGDVDGSAWRTSTWPKAGTGTGSYSESAEQDGGGGILSHCLVHRLLVLVPLLFPAQSAQPWLRHLRGSWWDCPAHTP